MTPPAENIVYPRPGDTFCNVVSFVVFTAFCHFYILGGVSSINVFLFYLVQIVWRSPVFDQCTTMHVYVLARGVNLVQNVGDVLYRESGGRSPQEAEAILDFCIHNFDWTVTITLTSTRFGHGCFQSPAAPLWNRIPPSLRQTDSSQDS